MQFRRVEVKRDGEWITCRLVEVKKGETFRMWESDDCSPVKDLAGRTEFVAAGDGYPSDELGHPKLGSENAAIVTED